MNFTQIKSVGKTKFNPVNSIGALALLLFLSLPTTGTAQAEQRWFQVELSIFTNEAAADRAAETWDVQNSDLRYPENLQRLNQITDLLMIDSLIVEDHSNGLAPNDQISSTADTQELNDQELNEGLLDEEQLARLETRQYILATGPRQTTASDEFSFFDLQRDSFLQLPPDESDFQQTNRELQRSADHRLLFHGLWRQPVVGDSASTPLFVSGGLQYGDHHELEGSITIRFNDNEDRVVIDADLWLNEFSAVEDPEQNWSLPDKPDSFANENGLRDSEIEFFVRQVYQFQQSRDMRSTEFHYLDHPALGLVILVNPYEVPEIPLPELESELEDLAESPDQ